MPLLSLDKKGNLMELNGSGEVRRAAIVEDGNLAFGEYSDAAQKVLNGARKVEGERRKALAKRKHQRMMEISQQMGEDREKAKIERLKRLEYKKKQFAEKSRLYTSALNQSHLGYDFTSLTGNPLRGFSKKDTYVSDKDLRGLGAKHKIEQTEHFGTNTIYGGHEYDGYMGDIFSNLTSAISSIPQQIIKVVKKAAPAAISLATKPLTAGVNIITETVTRGPEGALVAFKDEATGTLKDVKSVTMPVTEPAIKVAGAAWESQAGLMARKIVFNKYTDPGYKIKQEAELFRNTPVLGPVYKTVDKYSGGTLSEAELAVGVPGRLGRGEPVTKAELITAAVFAVKVGAVVASGGSAAAVIGFAAGQMKQGPLGASKEGRTLLTLAEVGAVAYTAAGSAAGAAGAASGAGEAAGAAGTTAASAGAAQAGTQVAQKTATQAMVQAVQQKAQSMAAEKVAQEVAKKTDTGVLGQIAVSSALGPSSFKDAAVAAGKQEATKEVAKQVGPEGMLIAQAAVAATSRVDSMKNMTPEQMKAAFAATLKAEAEKRVKEEAYKQVETELNKTVGYEAGTMVVAKAKGEGYESIAMAQVTKEEQKVLGGALSNQTAQINKLSELKQSDLAKLQSATPEQRTALIQDATKVDTQIVQAQADRNDTLTKLGFEPIQKQSQLSENAKVAGVPIAAMPNPNISLEDRLKQSALLQVKEALKVQKLEEAYYNLCLDIQTKVGKLKEYVEQLADLHALGKLLEEAALQALMLALQKEIEKLENQAVAQASDIEVQKLKSAVIVAAAQEGRYDASMELVHPMVKYGLA